MLKDESEITVGNIYQDDYANSNKYKLLFIFPSLLMLEIVENKYPHQIGEVFNCDKDTFMKFATLVSQKSEPPAKPKPHNCECGAYKAGYTKPGRAHAHSYCPMYKE